MSYQPLRHFALALILGSIPLLPQNLAHAATSSVHSPARQAHALSAVRIAQIRDSGPPVMEQAARLEATASPHAFVPPAGPRPAMVNNPRLYREVFGFAFASSLGDPNIGYPSWNFSLLSTVAYFGIHVDWTGDFSGGSALNTWNDPSGPVPGFIQTAHASGTKVVLTIAMFDSTSGTPNMCSALQRSSLTIQRVVNEITAKGIDGVNVDYESNNTMCKDPSTGALQSSQSLFTDFIAHLRYALPASGNYLSIDTYSGSAGFRDSTGAYLGFFDIGALSNYADSFFVMAYDMEYANWDSPPLSCPSFCIGPTAPLSTYLFNDGRASSEYRAVVSASKIIMGIPYYGRKECVAGPDPNQIPPNAIGSSVSADGYLDASAEATYPGNTMYVAHRETRDPLSATRWDTFSSTSAGCNREMYWDDVTALGNKYNLVINDHLRGAGIFALNYGGGAPELWNLINLKFGQCSQAAIATDQTSPQIPGTKVTFAGSALCAGTATFRFWMQPPGGAFSVLQDYSTQSSYSWDTTSLALGTYTFQVDARNLGSSGLDSYSRLPFRLARCVTPALTSNVASPQLPSTAVTFSTTVTCNGTPEYRFWVQPPGGAWSMVQDFSPSATFRWDTTRAAYGDYNIGVHVRVAGTTVAYESVQSIPYSLRSCISASLFTNKASPQPTGTQIGVSGSATCDGSAQFRFSIQPPGGRWSVVQDYSASSTFAWAGGGPGGSYNLEVDAKSVSAPTSSASGAQAFYSLAACSGVTLSTSPSSPQTPGPTVVMSGSATCPGTAQYRFWIHKPDGTVGVVQDYGTANTFSWNTAGLALGQYGLRVDTRNVGATSSYEAVATAYFVLADPPCSTPTVVVSPVSPQGLGTPVTFTASTGTCPQPLFEFWMLPPGSSTWLLAQGYSQSPTFRWNTNGAPPGDYLFSAWVRDAYSGSSLSTGLGSYDAFVGVPDTLTGAPCSAINVTSSPATSAVAGTRVTITGSATCNHAGPQYEFWMRPAGSSMWQLVQGYSSSATYVWNSTGAAAGTVYFGVWARDASSAASYDVAASIALGVSIPSCPSVTVSASPASPVAHGTGAHVTFTAVASGCSNPNPLYEFWFFNGLSWRVIQGWSTTATYDWNTTGAPAGTWQFGVWVRDAASSAAYDSFVGASYTLS